MMTLDKNILLLLLFCLIAVIPFPALYFGEKLWRLLHLPHTDDNPPSLLTRIKYMGQLIIGFILLGSVIAGLIWVSEWMSRHYTG